MDHRSSDIPGQSIPGCMGSGSMHVQLRIGKNAPEQALAKPEGDDAIFLEAGEPLPSSCPLHESLGRDLANAILRIHVDLTSFDGPIVDEQTPEMRMRTLSDVLSKRLSKFTVTKFKGSFKEMTQIAFVIRYVWTGLVPSAQFLLCAEATYLREEGEEISEVPIRTRSEWKTIPDKIFTCVVNETARKRGVSPVEVVSSFVSRALERCEGRLDSDEFDGGLVANVSTRRSKISESGDSER